ncbi:hypothetical protein SERLA73DRAFT_142741, partial [Serpula lacrymans var. lacrymans S7.3]
MTHNHKNDGSMGRSGNSGYYRPSALRPGPYQDALNTSFAQLFGGQMRALR